MWFIWRKIYVHTTSNGHNREPMTTCNILTSILSNHAFVLSHATHVVFHCPHRVLELILHTSFNIQASNQLIDQPCITYIFFNIWGHIKNTLKTCMQTIISHKRTIQNMHQNINEDHETLIKHISKHLNLLHENKWMSLCFYIPTWKIHINLN